MIRFDGYYISEPTSYKERKEFSPDYLTTAFLFQNNGYVNMKSKWSKNSNDVIFTEQDFLSDVSLVKYVFDSINCFYLHKHIGKPWEGKFYYDIISEKEIVSRQNGKSIKFVSWNT